MHLSEFIRVNSDRIIREWEEFAKTLTQGADLPRWVLRDHAAAIIRCIADNMEEPQPHSEEIAKAQGEGSSGPIDQVAAIHVGLRIDSGFDLVQIIAEYRALRSCVPRLWRISEPESFAAGAAEIVRFCEAIDQNIAEAIPHYQEREAHYRDRFLGMLGHDLRNPLDSISVCTTLLARQGLSEAQAGTLTRITRSTHHLDRMVRDILDFARGRLGSPMPLDLKQTDLASLLRDVVDEVGITHPEVPIRFNSTGDLRGAWDPERLRQMGANLLINAVSYGGGDAVAITASSAQDEVLIDVHNGGPPIRPELIPTIFDPLVQGENPDTSRTGLGLGLFIVKEIVSAHRGSIAVKSTQESGTTFSVRLPLTAG
jgi:signal transduction histidine kinase